VRLILEALGVVLVFEGLMPLLLPAHWKKTFSLMLALRDGQLRFFGLMSLLLGGALLLLACYVLA
jgi:uncharacterized protein YjeT (DUF2065 family)